MENSFEENPRDYALQLVELGVEPTDLLTMLLKAMSFDEVREVLDSNQLSPRFFEEEDRYIQSQFVDEFVE